MDHSSKTKILKQLARTDGEIAQKACEKEVAKIAAELKSEGRFDLIEQQIELLDIIAFRVPETAVGIVRNFIEHLRKLELTHDDELNVFDVNLTRIQNKNHLIIGVLQLLDHIRYHRLEDILEIFMSLYEHEDSEVRSQVVQGLEHLSEYNIEIFYDGENRAGFGPGPQLKLLDFLEAQSTADQQRDSSAIIKLCNQLLSPSMTSTTADYKTVTWSTSPVPASEEIKDIRRRSLKLLKGLYGITTTTAEKISAINTLLVATRTPHQGKYGDDVLEMILESTIWVLTFFKEVLPEENFQIVQKIEHDAFWRFKHAPSEEVKSAALEIRDLLATHDEYTIYKDLIGFEGVFEDWEESLNKKPKFGEIDKYRSSKAKEYADTINAENWADWRGRILRFVTTESDDMATFPKFFEFLLRFAEKSPDLALGLLIENLDDVRLFTVPLLRGLWKSPLKADLRALMLEWIAADRQLAAIAKLFVSNEDIDEEILGVLLNKGAEEGNRNILYVLVAIGASIYTDGPKDLVQKFFLPAVEMLTELEDTGWVHEFWYRNEREDILASLDEKGRNIILNGLLVASDIDYQAEELLVPVAEENPERILEFFGERLRIENEGKPDSSYDAIPFRFNKLDETLANFPDVAVDTVRSWYDGKPALFQYRGANLLKIIFPKFSEPFGSKLLQLLGTGERSDIEFVLSVLRNYEGEPFLHKILKAIVATLPKDDPLLGSIMIALRSTGIVSGEFGFAEAYERKIEEIKPWLNDGNEEVRNFAARYVTTLENETKSERRQAEEEIELRKHVYGVREEETSGEDGGSQQQEPTNEGDGKED